jgi:transposase-like protein
VNCLCRAAGGRSGDLRSIYTAVDQPAADAAFEVFAEGWQPRRPAIVRLWRSHWAEFVPFLAFPPAVRRGDLHNEPDRVDQRPAA